MPGALLGKSGIVCVAEDEDKHFTNLSRATSELISSLMGPSYLRAHTINFRRFSILRHFLCVEFITEKLNSILFFWNYL